MAQGLCFLLPDEIQDSPVMENRKFQKDIIKPLSKDFDCTPEELEHIFFEKLDMSQLLAFHATFETSQYECLINKLHADLRLCWFIGTLELVSKDDADELKVKLAQKIMDGQDYSDVLKEGQKELFELIKNSK